MRRFPKFDLPGVHFITTNVFRRHKVFTDLRYADIIFRALDAYELKFGGKIYGYVLMPDHLHMLLQLPEGRNISDFMRDFKKLTAHRILDLLKTDGNLQGFVQRTKGNRNYNFTLWQETFFNFNVYSERKLLEKFSYMHNDLVKAGLAADPGDYLYSSYGHYAFGRAGHLKVDPMD